MLGFVRNLKIFCSEDLFSFQSYCSRDIFRDHENFVCLDYSECFVSDLFYCNFYLFFNIWAEEVERFNNHGGFILLPSYPLTYIKSTHRIWNQFVKDFYTLMISVYRHKPGTIITNKLWYPFEYIRTGTQLNNVHYFKAKIT